ncbi:MAG: ABC transporter permease [Coriobacteriia bacterium]|nr:ABC transporter permease [Coriobacteriia bacterium]
MKFRDLAFEIWTALSANKGRSMLTILGIVIGIAAVVTLTSLIAGMRQQLLSTVGADQARLIQVFVSFSGESEPAFITTSDREYLEKEIPGVAYTGSLTQFFSASVSTAREKAENTSVSLATPGVLQANKKSYELKSGRYFMQSDAENYRQVAIIDTGLAKELYNTEDPDVIGQTITIDSDKYSIIGVVSSPQTFGMSAGSNVYIPDATGFRRYGMAEETYAMMVYTTPEADVDEVKTEVLAALHKRHPVPNSQDSEKSFSRFEAMTSKDMIAIVENITGVFTAILGSVASISLIVGGIGIMNMMLTNVSERIREIGLRKSVGAHASDITNQFLGESIVLCLIGGVIGLIIGYGAALGIAAIVSVVQPDMQFAPIVTPSIVAIAFGVSTLIGVIFGWGPAHKAAKLDPVESLRHQ